MEVAVELGEVVARAIMEGLDNVLEAICLRNAVMCANLAVRGRGTLDLLLCQIADVLRIERAAPVALLVKALGLASGAVILGEDDM